MKHDYNCKISKSKLNKIIRLNKVLRELNISTKRAVEFLASKNEVIEARPTVKITESQYLLLLSEFDASIKEKIVKKIQFKDLEKFYSDIGPQLYEKVVKNKNDVSPKPALSKSESISNLTNAFTEEKLVLVLGAGVSLNFGAPSWGELLQKLTVHTIEKDRKASDLLSNLFNDIFKPNPIISGRYLQNYFEKNNSSFENMVRNVLYQSIDKSENSELVNEITKYCVSPGKSPNLDSIITYNFDDILEHKLDQTQMDIPYKSIFGVGMEIKNDELPIYHVHGFLPENGKLNELNTITFGESNYHQQYSDIYSWNNIVQINKFRENICLFIGSSLTDPNIRRLLDIAYKQKGTGKKYHYIFKKKIKRADIIDEVEENGVSKSDEIIGLLIDIYEKFEENDSSSLGVRTIWIDEWTDIPKTLKLIRKSAIFEA